MESCQKSVVAIVLPLLIHLLTLQSGGAVMTRNDTDVSDSKIDSSKIILEEVIITGSGNNTRVTANAVAKNPSKIGDDILSLLSEREIRRGPSMQTLSNSDQYVDETRTVVINVDDEDDLETLKQAIAEYEPQRITSKKAKRKIVEASHDTHDISGANDEATESAKDFEKTYHEVLRNISRKVPQSVLNNAAVTPNPYLSQVIKNLKQIYVPESTIHTINSDETNKPHIDLDAPYKSSTLKKTKKLYKKYLQPNRTITPSQISPVAESKTDEKPAGNNKLTMLKDYFETLSKKTKGKNGSLSQSLSNIYSDSTETPENRREWNIQDPSIQIASPLESDDNNTYNIFNLRDSYEKKSSSPSDLNNLQLRKSKYSRVPRPFSKSQFSIATDTNANTETSYRKPDSSPTEVKYQQILRSSGNILPLVLPTELFNPPSARHYVPIKRANRFNLDGNSATIVTEANQPANIMRRVGNAYKKLSGDYAAPYTNVIGATRVPTITTNDRQSSGLSDYYAITETPAERTVAKTNSAATYIPAQTSASFAFRQQKDPQVIHGKFLPKIAAYDGPGEKSNLNANPGLALHNKFANLYSTDAPKAIATDYRDFKQSTSPSHKVVAQQVSALPYATLKSAAVKSISPSLSKIRPIAAAKPLAPYYNSRLLVLQDANKKELDDKDNDESVEVKEHSRVEDDETEKEIADDKGNLGDYKIQTNRGAYEIHETPNERREQEDHEENRYQEQKNDDEHRDKHRGRYDENDDIIDEKYENSRHKNDEDEEDAGETREGKYVSTEGNKDRRDRTHHHRYNKYEYRGDDPEEKQRKIERYDRKKYDKQRDHRDKYDDETDAKDVISSDKHSDAPRYKNYEAFVKDKEYGDRYSQKKSTHDNRYKKIQQGEDEEHEDDIVPEDKIVTQRANDRYARKQREKYRKERNNDKDTIYERKYHHHHQTILPRDSRSEEQKREEYSETNPKHAREEYHNQQQEVEDDHQEHRKRNDGNEDKEVRDHIHGESKEHAHKHEEHDKKKHGGNNKFEEGGGGEQEEEHHGHEGEKGDKGYKVWHEHEKAEKGYHDKEHARKEYDEKTGEKKKHKEEDGYHKEHYQDEEGKKTAEFDEKGEHKKGHSTKGEHSVHKKDEYEKKTEFFDEFHDDGGNEKHGEFHHEHESKKGGHEKKAHHDSAEHEEKYGKKGKHEKGSHHHEHKGHKEDEGHDHHYDHDEKYGKKEGHEHGKKWSFKKGDDGGGDGHKHNR